MVDHERPSLAPDLWSVFETEAMPHVDRLFRLAMWMERDRQEAEDLVQETASRRIVAAGSSPLSNHLDLE